MKVEYPNPRAHTRYSHTNPSQYLYLHKHPPWSLGLRLGKTQRSPWVRSEVKNTPNQTLACFVLYLKIINTLLKKYVHFISKLSKELETGIEISEGQAVLELLIKHYFDCLIHNLKTAWPTRISASFLRGCFAMYLKMHALVFKKKSVDHTTYANFKLEVQ